ncbi:MAG: hypothetical protein ACI89X_002961 [Planctomycetota bacterium]|jgi:hypothetical protein
MKRSLIVALFAIAAATTPVLSQDAGGQRPKRQKSPVKVEMEKMEEALDAVGDFLKKPDGKAPMAEITAAAGSLMEAKKHAPRAAARQPKEKQAAFVIAYQVEINKALRGILDLEDAMLTKDFKAAEAAMKALKAMEKAGHKVFKPRRRRGGKKPAGGGKK